MESKFWNCCGSCTVPFDTDTNPGKSKFNYKDNSDDGDVNINEAIAFIYRVPLNDAFKKLFNLSVKYNAVDLAWASQSETKMTFKFCEPCANLLELCYVSLQKFEKALHPLSIVREISLLNNDYETRIPQNELSPCVEDQIDTTDCNHAEDLFISFKSDEEECNPDEVDKIIVQTTVGNHAEDLFVNLNYDSEQPEYNQKEVMVDIKCEPLTNYHEIRYLTPKTSESVEQRKLMVKLEKLSPKTSPVPSKSALQKEQTIFENVGHEEISKCGSEVVEEKSEISVGRIQKEASQRKRCWKCEICGEEFPTYCHLKYVHMPSKHKERRSYICKICNKQYFEKAPLRMHHLRKHATDEEKQQNQEKCQFCGQLVFFQSMNFHLREHLRRKTKYQCVHCAQEFATKYTLEAHTLKHTGSTALVCDICSKTFLNKKGLRSHQRSHKAD